jgi:hypothetical protein
MLCPRCVSNQSDDVRFCTSCGANLQAVREVLAPRDPGTKFDWGDTWLAEMFRSGEAAELRKQDMERRLGITPEVKRYNEIKAGVITSSVGVGVAVFLFIFMQGVAAKVEPSVVEIITRLWVAGAIPFFIGLALIINGLVVSKKLVEIAEREEKRKNSLEGNTPESTPRSLRPADTNQFIPTNMSVTDQTTRHLENSEFKPKLTR